MLRIFAIFVDQSLVRSGDAVAVLPLVSSDDGYKHCEGIVRGWADSSTGREKDGDKLSLKDLLFFLHIPRTGGRAYSRWYIRWTGHQFGSQ